MNDKQALIESGVLAAGLGLAGGAFAMTFRGPRSRFWQRMTRTGLALGSLAVLTETDLRRPELRARDVALGLGSAAGLYGIFQVGDHLARRILPSGGQEIGDIYSLQNLRPRAELAARLGLIIGPAEELFWRGFVQRRLSRRFGAWPGAAVAAGSYGGAHIVTENLTLIGAASVAGAYWSTLAALGAPMSALIISHIAWDIWIFLVAPTQRPPADETPTPRPR